MVPNAAILAKLKAVKKIPVFEGLSLQQVQQVIDAGQVTHHPPGHLLCKDGDNSATMFILLAGELVIRRGNIELARIAPVEIVGEMGVVTGLPRCATIEVAKEASLLTIGRIRFELLLKNDFDMAAKVYKNILDSLSRKLRANNAVLVDSRLAAHLDLAASTI